MAKSNVDIVIKARDKASKQFGKIGKAAQGLSGSLKSLVVAGAAFFGFRALIRQSGAVVRAFNVQADAEKQLETTLKSTKEIAGLTAESLKNMASELQQVTRFGDETILSAQSLLLTFTNIRGDVFKETLIGALDMTEGMRRAGDEAADLKSTMILMGKALNDPIKGLTAMSKVGVAFTDVQKNLVKGFIEMGDVASAQKVILAELSTQFGGQAKAAAETFGGQITQLKNDFGDLQEQIGALLVPALLKMLPAMKSVIKGLSNLSLKTDIITTDMTLKFIKLSKDVTFWVAEKMVDDIETAFDNLTKAMTVQMKITTSIIKNTFQNLQQGAVSLVDRMFGEDPSGVFKPLLDGAGTAFDKFGPMAERAASDVEKVLTDQLALLGQKLLDSEAGGLLGGGGGFDIKNVAKEVIKTEKEKDKAKVKAILKPDAPLTQDGSVAAIESRFLTFANVKNPVNKSNQILNKILTTLEKQTTAIGRGVRKAQTTSGLNQLQPANFA